MSELHRTIRKAAESIVREWIGYYNNVRLHSALSYIAPFDHLQGRSEEIFATRDAKIEAARFQRQVNRRQQQASNESDKKGEIANTVDAGYNKIISLEDRALLRSTPSAREILGKNPTPKEMPMPEEQILVFS